MESDQLLSHLITNTELFITFTLLGNILANLPKSLPCVWQAFLKCPAADVEKKTNYNHSH